MKKKNAAQTTASDLLGAASNEELLRRERRANSAWSKLRRNKTAMVRSDYCVRHGVYRRVCPAAGAV